MNARIKILFFVSSLFMVCPFLSHGWAGEEKSPGQFIVRVFHTGNVAGKVSPCST